MTVMETASQDIRGSSIRMDRMVRHLSTLPPTDLIQLMFQPNQVLVPIVAAAKSHVSAVNGNMEVAILVVRKSSSLFEIPCILPEFDSVFFFVIHSF